MIRFIRGILREIENGLVVVEAGGIGYGIRVPASVMGELPVAGEEVVIYTYFSVREDAMELFGFLSQEDREMFVTLLSVSGIGPKGALAILSTLRPDELRLAIASNDVKLIQSAPGIGKRSAERLILELKDKVDLPEFSGGDPGKVKLNAGGRLSEPAKEAVEALISLGYSPSEAHSAVAKVSITGEMNADDVLKESLRNLSYL